MLFVVFFLRTHINEFSTWKQRFSTAMATNARMKRGNVFCTTEQYSFSADHLERGFKSDTFKSLEETFARLSIVAIEG